MLLILRYRASSSFTVSGVKIQFDKAWLSACAADALPGRPLLTDVRVYHLTFFADKYGNAKEQQAVTAELVRTAVQA